MLYKFKEDAEEAKKPLNERTIEKHGDVHTFTLIEVFHSIDQLRKQLKEAVANRDNQQVVMSNIEQHHPFVKDIPEFDRYTVHMYQEACAKRKGWNEQIARIEDGIKIEEESLAEVHTQIPETASVPSPYLDGVKVPEKKEDAGEAPREEVSGAKIYCRADKCEKILDGVNPEELGYCELHKEFRVKKSEESVDNSNKQNGESGQ